MVNEHNLFNDSHHSRISGSSSKLSLETITTELPINSEHSRRKRSAGTHHNHEYTIEVLVAVDRRMQEKHGSSLQDYVLTLMSTVSHFWYFWIHAYLGCWVTVCVICQTSGQRSVSVFSIEFLYSALSYYTQHWVTVLQHLKFSSKC